MSLLYSTLLYISMRKQTIKEEKVNTITHFIGIMLSITALAFMIERTLNYGTITSLISSVTFGISLVVLYSASTFYHASKRIQLKEKLNKFDHSAIYILIAGTYTPFTLVLLEGAWGWGIFIFQWTIAIIGVFFKIFWYNPKYRAISAWAYVAMGLVIVVAILPLTEKLSTMGLVWLALGGVFYIGGVFFYLAKRLPYSHGIWHLFVLAGSIAHFISIYKYVL